MELKNIKEAIEVKVYHIKPEMKVPPHDHKDKDEIFYCIKGSGVGVLSDSEVELTVGKAFIVPAGQMHSLKTEDNLHVASFIVPVVDER